MSKSKENHRLLVEAGPASPSKRQVYEAAKSYVASGLSLIPIRADGSKQPAFELLPRVWSEEEGRYRRPWSPYKKQPPNLHELRPWFRDSDDEYGVAILGGAVSSGLEIIDLDNWGVVEPWVRLVVQKAPGLLRRLVLVKTPRPGMHAYYRCETFGGNQKLARIPDPEQDNKKPKTIIEVKGEAGYCLAPPSPAGCHKTGRCYTFMSDRDLTAVPTITAEERQVLLDCARSLNCWNDPRLQTYRKKRRPSTTNRFQRPGDDFNDRADWADILKPHGWTWEGRGDDGSDRWCRPGKSCGTSATSGFGGSDLLFVFGSNADPFDEWKAYDKFAAHALLEHDGDFALAARALRRKGYGALRSRRGSQDPYERYAGYPVRRRRP